jgi:hypothetical protein
VPLNADWLNHFFLPWNAPTEPLNKELDDPCLNVYPLQKISSESLRRGVLPLWLSDAGAGCPLLADNTALPLSVFKFLGAPFSWPWTYGFQVFLQHLMLGVGVYLLAKQLGLSQLASSIAACAMLFCETTVVWLEFHFWLSAFCWCPWICWTSLRAIQGRQCSSVLCAFAVGLCLLSGQLQVCLYSIFGGCALAILMTGPERLVSKVRTCLSAIVLGTALAAVQCLPTWELIGQGFRASSRYERVNFLQLSEILTWVLPDFFGNPGTHDFQSDASFNTSYLGKHGGFIGTMSLLFAVLAATQKKKVCRRLGLAFLIGFLLLLVNRPVVQRFLSSLIPVVGQLHHKRALCLLMLILSLLAGFGADALVTSSLEFKRRLGFWLISFALASAVIVSLAGFLTGSDEPGSILGTLSARTQQYGWLVGWPTFLLPISSLGLLGSALYGSASWCAEFTGRHRKWPVAAAFILLAFELLYFGGRYNPYVSPEQVYPPVESLSWLQERQGGMRMCAVNDPSAHPDELPEIRPDYRHRYLWKGQILPPNTALSYGLNDVRIKQSLLTRRYRLLFDRLKLANEPPVLVSSHFSQLGSPILDALSVKYLMTPKTVTDYPDHYKVVYDKEVLIFENSSASPKAYVVSSEDVRQADPVHIPERLEKAPDHNLTFVERPALKTEEPASASQQLPEIVTYTNHHVEIAVLDSAGLLVLTDAWYPGWKAYVDGSAVPTQPVNLIVRGVWIQKHATKVEWVFDPLSVKLGFWISGIGLLIICGIAGSYLVQRLSF